LPEISQVRKRLVLPGWHEEAISAQEIVFVADLYVIVGFAAVLLPPDRGLFVGFAAIALLTVQGRVKALSTTVTSIWRMSRLI
jgi:hypothetical protein